MFVLQFQGKQTMKILVDGPVQPDGSRVFAETNLTVVPGEPIPPVTEHVATVVMTDPTLQPLFTCSPPIGGSKLAEDTPRRAARSADPEAKRV